MTFTHIFVETHRWKRNKYTIFCEGHGDIAVRYLPDEAQQIAADHEWAHRCSN